LFLTPLYLLEFAVWFVREWFADRFDGRLVSLAGRLALTSLFIQPGPVLTRSPVPFRAAPCAALLTLQIGPVLRVSLLEGQFPAAGRLTLPAGPFKAHPPRPIVFGSSGLGRRCLLGRVGLGHLTFLADDFQRLPVRAPGLHLVGNRGSLSLCRNSYVAQFANFLANGHQLLFQPGPTLIRLKFPGPHLATTFTSGMPILTSFRPGRDSGFGRQAAQAAGFGQQTVGPLPATRLFFDAVDLGLGRSSRDGF